MKDTLGIVCLGKERAAELRAHFHIASKMPSSNLHRRFIEASSNFWWSYTKIPFTISFQKIKINLKLPTSQLHRCLIETLVHAHEKFDEVSMKRR